LSVDSPSHQDALHASRRGLIKTLPETRIVSLATAIVVVLWGALELTAYAPPRAQPKGWNHRLREALRLTMSPARCARPGGLLASHRELRIPPRRHTQTKV